jgi:hypothetical protein
MSADRHYQNLNLGQRLILAVEVPLRKPHQSQQVLEAQSLAVSHNQDHHHQSPRDKHQVLDQLHAMAA